MVKSSKIKLFLFLWSTLSLINNGTFAQRQKEVEYNTWSGTDKYTVPFNSAEQKYTPENAEAMNYCYMTGVNPANIEHALMIIMDAAAARAISNQEKRARLDEFYDYKNAIEEASGGKVKVLTAVIRNVRGLEGRVSGQSIEYHWKNFNNTLSYRFLSIFGVGQFNVLTLRVDDPTQFYRIHEDPYLRYYFLHITDVSSPAIKLSPAMAKEYPIPHPSLAIGDEQQSLFQMVKTNEQLHAEQQRLQQHIIESGRLGMFDVQFRKDLLKLRREKYVKHIMENPDKWSTTTKFYLYDFDGSKFSVTPKEMKIYRTTNGEYIPDPVHVDYSLLDDGTSTRQLLILALNKKRGDVFLHPSNAAHRKEIEQFLGWLIEYSEKLTIKMIITVTRTANIENAMGGWADAHKHRDETRDPFQYTSTFGIDNDNVPFLTPLDGVAFTIYENVYLRYGFNNLNGGTWLQLTRAMAQESKVIPPSEIWKKEHKTLYGKQIQLQKHLFVQQQKDLGQLFIEFPALGKGPEIQSLPRSISPVSDDLSDDFDRIFSLFVNEEPSPVAPKEDINLVRKGPLVAARKVEFNTWIEDRVESTKFLVTEDPKTTFKPEIKDITFMHGVNPATVKHVLMIMVNVDKKKVITDRPLRQRLSELKVFKVALERISNGLLVRTAVITSTWSPHLSQVLGQMIDFYWKQFNGKKSHECISTLGVHQFNMPVLRNDGSGQFYVIYENPYLRYFMENADKQSLDIMRLVGEMAEEFPVPLPSEVQKDPIQRVFQVNTDTELAKIQNELRQKMVDPFNFCIRLSKRHALEMRWTKLYEKLASWKIMAQLSVHRELNSDAEVEMPLLRKRPGRSNDYIPDQQHKDYTYVKDETKHILFMIFKKSQWEVLQTKEARKKNINEYLGWLKKNSGKLDIITLVIDSETDNLKEAIGGWIDWHGWKKEKREPRHFVSTMSFFPKIEAVKFILLDGTFTLQEDLYLRYAIDALSKDYWMTLDEDMASLNPVPLPNVEWVDHRERQERLQRELFAVQNEDREILNKNLPPHGQIPLRPSSRRARNEERDPEEAPSNKSRRGL